MLAAVLDSLACVAMAQGDYERAAALFAEALAVSWDLGDKWVVLGVLGHIAELAVSQGQAAQGVQLTGAEAAGRDTAGIPNVPVDAFAVDPMNSMNLFAGTDIGVYASTNGGTSWSPYGTGLPVVAVFDMAIQSPYRLLRIATHGRGMWETTIPGTPTAVMLESSSVHVESNVATMLQLENALPLLALGGLGLFVFGALAVLFTRRARRQS